jgi:hypothetical protein
VRTLTQKDQWGALFKRYRDERRPAGMGTKTKDGVLHKTPSEQSEYVATITRGTHNGKGQHQCLKKIAFSLNE